ncbi:hypothetical protein AWC38_SpisGene23667 [Stylophora pistillata]|uniref:Uncharacterized protein n=1 Tax=Stylophora pistillata TaxID=50429 RepID=A0A2B4R216_STYPI|nr:hypothetical protein AWC38_SpisGene23667 [Stylophora pistillata]
MSVKLLPIHDYSPRKYVQEASLDGGVVIPLQLGISLRLKMANTRSDLEGERAERARAIFKSQAGYIGALTKLQGNIEEFMENCRTLEDLKSKRKSYDAVCHKFVSTHEQYLECLELLCYEEELVKARVSYVEQMSRRLTFDNVIETLIKKSKLESKKVSERSLSLTRKSRRGQESKSSYSSSFSTSVVKKKEKLALAQLKTKRSLKEQQLKRKMIELQYKKEFMEARMEEERAAVSLDVYKQAEVENECCNVDNMDILSIELESSAIQGTELCYSNEEPYRSDERANVVVQPIPFECTPVPVRVPSEQLPASGNVSCGQKTYNKQVPKEFQSTHPIEYHILDPVKVKSSDGFLGEGSAKPPLSQQTRHLPHGTIVPRQGSGEEIAQALRQVVSAPKAEYMRFDGNPMKRKGAIRGTTEGPPPSEPDNGSTSQSQPSRESLRLNASDGSNFETSNQDRVNVTAATGAGERVCLSVVPLKVQIKGSDLPTVETYALFRQRIDGNSLSLTFTEETWFERTRLNFTLSGMTGSTRVESQLLDIVVKSIDEMVSVELPIVRTVKQMPISIDCIVKKGDITRWSHMCDIKIQELEVEEVMLVISLKERPSLFRPQEYKAGEEDEPVAVRYSLGWTVIGPVHDQKDDSNCSANFTRTTESSTVYDNLPVLRDEHKDSAVLSGRVLQESNRDSEPQHVCRRHDEVDRHNREGNQFSKSAADVARERWIRLTRWYRNDREVMATIPESERAKSVTNLELERLPTESALGLKWNIEEDKFVKEVMEKMLQRRYVNRDDNPADDGSKGLKIDTMLRDDRCLKGPKFLWEDKSHWPNMIKIPVLGDDDEEVRKDAQIYFSTVQKLQIPEREIFKRVQQVAFPEVIDVLSATEFCEDKRRFISVRGYPEKIRSDQGSNFIKADKELKEAIEEWNEHKINNFCRKKRIEWILIRPQRAT